MLVDDEKKFLKSLKDGLHSFSNIFETDICFSVNEAIKQIENQKYDLVITDLRMPKKSGIDLLIYLNQVKFSGKLMVMSAYNTEENLKQIKSLGIVDIISKPFKIDWFTEKLLDFFSGEKDDTVVFESIDLLTVMQIINLERKTAAIQIEYKNKNSYIYFQDGEIVNAEFEDLDGMDAIRGLIARNKGLISIKQLKRKIKKNLSLPFNEIMMETMKEIDELRQNIKEKPIQSKEKRMDTKKINQIIEKMQKDLGEGLLATDLWNVNDAQSIAGFNPQPKAVALFNQVTEYLTESLKRSGFPSLGKYYIIDLEDGKYVVVIPMNPYQWGMLIDGNKVKLGLLLNITIPEMISAFTEATSG